MPSWVYYQSLKYSSVFEVFNRNNTNFGTISIYHAKVLPVGLPIIGINFFTCSSKLTTSSWTWIETIEPKTTTTHFPDSDSTLLCCYWCFSTLPLPIPVTYRWKKGPSHRNRFFISRPVLYYASKDRS